MKPRLDITPARVQKIVRRWLREFGMDRMWDLGVRVHRSDAAVPEEYRDALAYAFVRDGTFLGTIDVCAHNFTATTSLEEVVAHEVTHVLLWRLQEIAKAAAGERLHPVVDAEVESVVETLSRVFGRLGRGAK